MKNNGKTVKKSSKSNSNQQCSGDLEYESLFDDARNMAFTLRKIDQELRIAAQCEGDYPGGYPSNALLPALCKIMYSNTGSFKSKFYDLNYKGIS